MSLRIGVDIGGTFTDFTIVDELGNVSLWKEDSTPDEPGRAIRVGLDAVAENLGRSVQELLGDTRLFVHGSTIATNTVIQRNGPRIGLVCTKGFRDVPYFRDGFKWERFNMHLTRPPDFVDRYLRIGVDERVNYAGEVLTPLNEDDVCGAAEQLREAGVAAVAVAFLWSIVNPAHERRTVEILREELPDVYVLSSADVLPEIREWERTSATTLSAYVLPKIASYLGELEGLLDERGLEGRPLIMQINGGCASVEEILRRPVYSLASGPAAAPAAAGFHAQETGADNLITVDMGGTSFDVCVIRAGRPAMSRNIMVEYQPLGVSGVEVHSIGAGGGSIAWLDSGGALQVGPRSAGAKPGPACYGAGGTEPTVTDANVVLGYLSPAAFLGGRRTLRADLSEAAIQGRIADSLGLDVTRAAAGIVQVVNSNMVAGIRAVSIERGIDPRGFTLVSGGGAGGLHAARLARQLRMRQVLIPREASTFCAFGMTVTDVRHDYTGSFHALSSELDLDRLNALFADLERDARDRLRSDGFTEDQIRLERSVDARYPNQIHEITVEVPSVETFAAEDVKTIEETFHREHEQQYTYSIPELPAEFLHWRVSAFGVMALGGAGGHASTNGTRSSGDAARTGEREAYSEEHGERISMPVYAAENLTDGAKVTGPAIIEATTTTIVINPGDVLQAGRTGSFLVEIAAA